eukprot:3763916-Prymnesium_polylepis.1
MQPEMHRRVSLRRARDTQGGVSAGRWRVGRWGAGASAAQVPAFSLRCAHRLAHGKLVLPPAS